MDEFAFVAMELCVKYQYEIFQSADAITQDQQSFKELIYALFVTAKTIVRRMNPKEAVEVDIGIFFYKAKRSNPTQEVYSHGRQVVTGNSSSWA
ncbi:uncharacterized protein LOC131257789 isoform X2 [Magnolia sinica]|uniref:uncharacterized protein LOC131257789 isoform X2 n=1 Tax=Magnolia sinica TaxID=86752 RepID=UPI00265B38EC|nr:uncharacterized protein LOC131257789 isoform X2 [Magnolia sinica]XP_058114667.1 uncharacterized protein LOC131257789 isoform X2 [Magnolia sinica]